MAGRLAQRAAEGTRPRSRGLGYVRVSKGREEMISPEIQETAIRAFAERENIDLVDVMYDLDLTGREFGKRKVAQIIDRIGAGEAEVVVLFKWSRFGRNLMHSLVNLEKLKDAGGKARAATEDFDDETTMGKFSRDQLLLIYELQSNQIGDGWKDVQAHRRARGLPHNGAPRFGYLYEKGSGYTPDPVTGPLLADAYRRWVAGTPLRALALEWQAKGVRSARGKVIPPVTLLHIMDTGFAAGYLRSRSKPSGRAARSREEYDVWTRGAHEPLIDEATWQAFLAKRNRNADMPRRLRTPKYALSGLVVCGECGSPMRASGGQDGRGIWRCARSQDTKQCPGASGRREVAERVVYEWLVAHARGEDEAAVMLARKQAARQASDDAAMYEREVARLVAKRKRLADAYTDGAIEHEDYLEQRARIAEQLDAASTALEGAREEAGANTTPTREVFQGLADAWERIDVAAKREALSKVVARVVIRSGPPTRPDKYEVVPRWAASEVA